MGRQTDPDISVKLVSAATQTEETESSSVESPAVPGAAAPLVADVMQTEDLVPSEVHLPSEQDASLSVATDAVAWQAPRRRNRRRQKATLDDDDALLNSATTSVAQERSELANAFSHQVLELEHVVRRVGLVCPRRFGRHHVVACGVMDATRTRCPRCNTLPELGEVGAGCAPCDEGWVFRVVWNFSLRFSHLRGIVLCPTLAGAPRSARRSRVLLSVSPGHTF